MRKPKRDREKVEWHMNIGEIEKKLVKAKSGNYKICAWGAGYVGRTHGYEMIKKMGIHVDFYCDNNTELHGKIIRDNIVCINPKTLEENTFCFILTSGHLSEDITKELHDRGVVDIISYMELCEYYARDYFEVQKRNQIAVYTCVVGDYDDVHEPIGVAENCDYYIISDKEPAKNSIYKYININDCISSEINDNTRKNRYCKINAHEMFPQYRYSVYFDGNIVLDNNIVKYLEHLPKTRITMMSRSNRDSVYAEALRCILHGRDNKEIIEKQVEKYWVEGMPDDFGLVEPALMIREHNNPICKKLMKEWWDEICMFSKRDMISFPYVLWKNGYTINDVNMMSDNLGITSGEGWKLRHNHRKSRV